MPVPFSDRVGQDARDFSVHDSVDLRCLIQRCLDERLAGELTHQSGEASANICVYHGYVAWARCTTHPQHLGDVLSRECGLPLQDLYRALKYCRERGLRLGEGLMELDLVSIDDLSACLRLHVVRHLMHCLRSARHGGLWAWQPRSYRYDERLIFGLPDLLGQGVLDVCVSGFPSLRYAGLHNFTPPEVLLETNPNTDIDGLLAFAERTRDQGSGVEVVGQYASAPEASYYAHRIPWERDQLLLVMAGPKARGALGHFLGHAHKLLGD